jgi:hypothetical protein
MQEKGEKGGAPARDHRFKTRMQNLHLSKGECGSLQ